MMNRWRCTVCGYLHEGSEPPEFCPVCHAERAAFVVAEERVPGLVSDLLASAVPHAIVVHLPQGVLPAAALFWLLSFVNLPWGAGQTAWHLVLLLPLVMPVALVTGYRDWRVRLGRQPNLLVRRKIRLGFLLWAASIVAALLWWRAPAWGMAGRVAEGVSLGLMFGLAVLLGHFGGKLVFASRTPR